MRVEPVNQSAGWLALPVTHLRNPDNEKMHIYSIHYDQREVSMEEKPWFKSYDPGMPYTLRPYPESTLLDTVRDTVQQRPKHTALIFKGRHMSYA